MKTNLKQEEKLIMKVKRHGLMLAMPLIAFIFFAFMGITMIITNKEMSGFGTGLVLVFLIYFVYKVLDWRTNIFIVTNLRVIHEHGVLSISAKESPLDKINNVSFNQTLFGRMFDYGNVQIQSAAELGATSTKFLKSPRKLKDNITQKMDDFRKEQIAQQAESMAKAIRGTQSSSAAQITEETKECPFCAETIKLKAKICKHCGKDLPV